MIETETLGLLSDAAKNEHFSNIGALFECALKGGYTDRDYANGLLISNQRTKEVRKVSMTTLTSHMTRVIFFFALLSPALAVAEEIEVLHSFGGSSHGSLPLTWEGGDHWDDKVATFVVRSQRDFERFQGGLPDEAMGKYLPDEAPKNDDPLKTSTVDFDKHMLLIVFGRHMQCSPRIRSVSKATNSLNVEFEGPEEECLSLLASDRGSYHAVLVPKSDVEVRFNRSGGNCYSSSLRRLFQQLKDYFGQAD